MLCNFLWLAKESREAGLEERWGGRPWPPGVAGPEARPINLFLPLNFENTQLGSNTMGYFSRILMAKPVSYFRRSIGSAPRPRT